MLFAFINNTLPLCFLDVWQKVFEGGMGNLGNFRKPQQLIRPSVTISINYLPSVTIGPVQDPRTVVLAFIKPAGTEGVLFRSGPEGAWLILGKCERKREKIGGTSVNRSHGELLEPRSEHLNILVSILRAVLSDVPLDDQVLEAI